MRIYVEIKNRNLSLDYRELAEKMWFKTYLSKELELSHEGDSSWLNDKYTLDLKWDKSLNDKRWVKNKFATEYISLNPIRDKKYLYFETQHIDIVTVDKRALYIMVKELAEAVEGSISQDGMTTWMPLDIFEEQNHELFSMSFETANEISLKESEMIELVDESWDNEVSYD